MQLHVQRNHLKLNFLMSLFLIAWIIVALTVLPWAKRPEETAWIGPYWYSQPNAENPTVRLMKLLDSSECHRLIQDGADEFCDGY